MPQTLKLRETIIERKLRNIMEIEENQYAYMLERSTMELICILRQQTEKYRVAQKDCCAAFINAEMGYNHVIRKATWKIPAQQTSSSAKLRKQSVNSQA